MKQFSLYRKGYQFGSKWQLLCIGTKKKKKKKKKKLQNSIFQLKVCNQHRALNLTESSDLCDTQCPQTIAWLLFKCVVSFPVKRINFVPKIVSIWLGKRNISIPLYCFRIIIIYIFLWVQLTFNTFLIGCVFLC